MSGAVHHYRTELAWSGSTGVGYEAYERAHELRTPTVDVELALSGDAAFRGDPSRWNPEQLLVASASSCQLLSFLAVCARARLDVVAYADEAHGVMPEDDPPLRIVRIELHPVVSLADTGRPRPSAERLRHLAEVAHRECFIANSLRTEVAVDPTFTWVG
ncbi:MAG: OsmC family protein [Actinobacteria bacterium]|nr:OsmC family protein [Actinomycetota bacterium]